MSILCRMSWNSQVTTKSSRTFERLAVRAMDCSSFSQVTAWILGTGVRSASFQSVGTLLDDSDWLKILATGSASSIAYSLIIRLGILSGPSALNDFTLSNLEQISTLRSTDFNMCWRQIRSWEEGWQGVKVKGWVVSTNRWKIVI